MAKSAFGILEPIMNRFRPQSSRPILRQFSGTVNAGEMLLVIGKPGSGCTTFLKTLANMRDEYKETTGDITYGGRSSDDMTAKYPQDITFCGMSKVYIITGRLTDRISRGGRPFSHSERGTNPEICSQGSSWLQSIQPSYRRERGSTGRTVWPQWCLTYPGRERMGSWSEWRREKACITC